MQNKYLSRSKLHAASLGNGAFNLGYGLVSAGDTVEGGVEKYHQGQVIEVFPDGDAWVNWYDEERTSIVNWRYIRKV